MVDYVKCFDSTKAMSFKVNSNNLSKTYTKIWKEISSLMDTEFDSERVYGDNDKDIRAKVKTYRVYHKHIEMNKRQFSR